MSDWIDARTGKSWGTVYESDELSVTYFERAGSPDCTDGRYVQITGPGHPVWARWHPSEGKVFRREDWDRMLEAATGRSEPAP